MSAIAVVLAGILPLQFTQKKAEEIVCFSIRKLAYHYQRRQVCERSFFYGR